MEDCKRSGSSRTVAEICLIRLCDPSLDGSNAGLAARIAKLEAAVAQGIPARPAQQPAETPAPTTQSEQPPWDETTPPPPGEEDAPPLEPEYEAPPATPGGAQAPAAQQTASPAQPQPQGAPAPAGEWPKLVAAMHGVVRMPAYSFLKHATDTVGIRQGNLLTIYFKEDFAYDQVNKPEVIQAIAEVVSAQVGCAVQVELRKGLPDQGKSQLQPAPKPVGSMNDLKNFMQQHQK